MGKNKKKDERTGGLEAHPNDNPITAFAAVTTYFSYAVLIIFGHFRDFCAWLFGTSRFPALTKKTTKGYAPLLKSWENFYTRRLYMRIIDVFNRPITGPAGAHIDLLPRKSRNGTGYDVDEKGNTRRCLNLGS